MDNPMPTKPARQPFLQILGQRVVVHLIAILLSYQFARELNTMIPLLVYVGIICLIPRGDVKKASWYVPVGAGVLQLICGFVLSFGAPYAFFWAGCQSWMQRIVERHGKLCWDWIVVPVLVVSLDVVYECFTGSWLFVLASFTAIFAVGLVAQLYFGRRGLEEMSLATFEQDLEVLRAHAKEAKLPKPLFEHVQVVLNQSELLANNCKGRVKELLTPFKRIHAAVQKLAAYTQASKPSEKSGWAQGLLRSENWRRKGDKNEQELQALWLDLRTFLTQELRKLHIGTMEDKDLEGRLQAFEDCSNTLLVTGKTLPPKMQPHVEQIAALTLEIIKNMRLDPQDRAPGDRFLSRYLPATQKICEEYLRLSQGPVQKDVEEALKRSCEMLERLEAAFRDELASLLQNDAINFTAEMQALDAMLRMKGH